MTIGLTLLALCLLCLVYLELIYVLNIKATEWALVLLEGFREGLITPEYYLYEISHPPFSVRVIRKIDILPALERWNQRRTKNGQ